MDTSPTTETKPDIAALPAAEKYRRLKALYGITLRAEIECGRMYVTVNGTAAGPSEVICHMGKCGQCVYAQSQGMSRLITLALQHGCSIKEIVGELEEIECPEKKRDAGEVPTSCQAAVARALNYYDKHK